MRQFLNKRQSYSETETETQLKIEVQTMNPFWNFCSNLALSSFPLMISFRFLDATTHSIPFHIATVNPENLRGVKRRTNNAKTVRNMFVCEQ